MGCFGSVSWQVLLFQATRQFNISTHSTAKEKDKSHREEKVRKKMKKKERTREWGKKKILIISRLDNYLINRATIVSIIHYNFIK